MCLNPIMPSHLACPWVFTFDWFLGRCWSLRCIIFNSMITIKPQILSALTHVGGAPSTAFHGLVVSKKTSCALVIEPLFLWNSRGYFQGIVQLHHFFSPGHTSRALLLWCIQPTNLIFHLDWLWIRVGDKIVLSISVRLSRHLFSCLLYICMVFTPTSFIHSSPRNPKSFLTSCFEQHFWDLMKINQRLKGAPV